MAMTCSHVLSNICSSLLVRGEPTQNGYQPDAALIRTPNPCFPIPLNSRTHLPCASPNDIDLFTRARSIVRKIFPAKTKPAGFISSRVVTLEVNGSLYRFPHLEILPRLIKVAGLIVLPVFDRYFSEPGDSGSWVVEEKSGSWVGMVVGGKDFFLISYVAEATPLIQYFEARLANASGGVNLIPISYK